MITPAQRFLLKRVLFALTLSAAILPQGTGHAQQPAARPAQVTKIVTDQATADIFPVNWRGGKVNATAVALAEPEAARFRMIAKQALAKYPPGLTGRTLKAVYGLARLEYSGVQTGGTRSADAIYALCKANVRDADTERILHAEYSSLLYLKFADSFDTAAWNKANPEDFQYLGSGVAAVRAGKASIQLKPQLYERGFLSEYAQASVEEDFNAHAGRLMMGDSAYWQAVEKHPRLKAKAELAMSFYAKVDAGFKEAAFATLRREAARLTTGRIFTDKEFDEEKLDAWQWSKRGAHAFALEKPAQGKDGKDLVKLDAATGARTVLATAQNMTPPGAKKPLTVAEIHFSMDEKQALLFTNTKKVWRKNTRGDYWLLDLTTKRLQKLGGEGPEATMMFGKFSPDGTRVAFVRTNQLYVQNLTDLKVTRVSPAGGPHLIHGTSDWVNEEELGLRDCFRWSPDGAHLLFWEFDTTGVKTFALVNQTDSTYPRITTFHYPKAGEVNSKTRLGIVSSQGGEVTWLKAPGDPREHYLPFAEWTPDGSAVLVQQFNRLQNTLHVMLAIPQTGEVKGLFTETDEAWVDNKNNEPRWVGNDFLWLSERSGWRHLYLADLKGGLKPVTQGGFDVIDLTCVDAKGGTVDFLASPENATQRYLYRVPLAGGEPRRLSPRDQAGTHSYVPSTDARWAVHTFSNVTTPPVVELVSLPEHQTVRVLKSQEALREKLAGMKLPRVEFIRVPLGQGLVLDGWMMRAADLDLTKKHPLLVHVYGEPAGQTVKDVWGGARQLWHAMLAQEGYVVASVDTRGTPSPRGREWRRAVYRKLGIMNADEEAAAVRALLKEHAWLDAGRVGIWGWSGGGSSSLDAIFRFPDLYQTAIAVAPVPDRRLYDSIYEERYMGLPKDNAAGYKNGSPITHAAGLKGNLLIVHGTGDDNVHYQGVEKLMNELIALNKPFTVMPYPNRDHAINTGKGTSRHLYDLMTSYLRSNLRVKR